MTLCLLDLAPETQHSIYELLDSSDIFSFSLTSRSSRFHSQFALYSQIHLHAGKGQRLRIKLLLRTLLARPELAQCVQHLYLQEWGYNMPMQCSSSIPRKDERYAALELDSELVAEATSWASNLPPAPWIDSLRGLESTDAEIAFLLSMLPNLRSLSLKLNFTYGTKVLGQMLRAAVCQPHDSNSGLHAFRNLRHICMSDGLSGYRKQKIDDNADILPFFYMPSITSLSMPVPNRSSFNWPTHAPNSSSLSDLHLHRLREDHLEPVLSAHKRLRKLVWTCTCVDGYDQLLSKREINLGKVGSAVSSLRDTLEDLELDVKIPGLSRSYHAPQLTLQGSLKGLGSMTRLKSLSLPWVYVMGQFPKPSRSMTYTLPSSLEHIRFTDKLMVRSDFVWNSHAICSALKFWLEHELASFPNLHTIVMDFRAVSDTSDEDWYRCLNGIRSQAPINIIISSRGGCRDEGAFNDETMRLTPKKN